MSTSPGGITFEETDTRVSATETGAKGVREFIVQQGFSIAFAKELFGVFTSSSGPSAPVVSWTPAIPFPGLSWLVCNEVTINPLMPGNAAGDTGLTLSNRTVGYTGTTATSIGSPMKMVATYEAMNLYNHQYGPVYAAEDRSFLTAVQRLAIQGTRITYEEDDIGGQVLQIPGRSFKWKGSSPAEYVSDDAAAGINIPQRDFVIKWDRVLFPPFATMDAMIGKVNSATFLAMPAGTVLYNGTRVDRKFLHFDYRTFYSLSHRFSYQAKQLTSGTKVGWNYMYKETALAGKHWVEVEDRSAGSPYKSGDFSTLFAYGY